MEIKFLAIKHVLIFIKNLIRIRIPDTAPDPEGRWKQIQYECRHNFNALIHRDLRKNLWSKKLKIYLFEQSINQSITHLWSP